MTRRILGLNLGGRAKIGGLFGWRKFGGIFLPEQGNFIALIKLK